MNRSGAADSLLRSLEPPVRLSVRRRVEKMERQYDYLRSVDEADLAFALSRGWSDQKFSVLFVLNSIYQLCIGPLHASANASGAMGSDIVIRHGSDAYGRARAREVNMMASDYDSLATKLGLDPKLLQKNTCKDLVYWIARDERELDV